MAVACKAVFSHSCLFSIHTTRNCSDRHQNSPFATYGVHNCHEAAATMEALISSPGLDVSAVPWKAEQPGQLDLPATAPTFLPVRISDSGSLVLDPGQTEDAYMKQLQKLRHSKETLQKAGYVMQPLTEIELDQKKKCGRCHKGESVRPCVMPQTGCHRSDGLSSRLQEAVQAHL